MGEEVKLRIGGIGISIEWDGSRIIGWPHPHYQSFIFDGKADVNLRIHCGHLPEYSKDEILFDGEIEGYWKLYQNNSRYIVEIYDTMTHKKEKVCLIEPNFSDGDVYIEPELERLHQPTRVLRKLPVPTRIGSGKPLATPVWSLPLLMGPLGEILLVNILTKKEGIMVHGLGINDRGIGIAFLGSTGTGKSTLAGFYKSEREVNILSDEHIIIRRENGKFLLYGTPWPGMAMVASSEGVPLKRIFFVEHGPVNKILGRGTTSDLFPLLFLPFWDKMRMGLILEFCEELLKTIKCRKLGFIKDKTVVEFIRKEAG